MKVALDTEAIIAARRSRSGASNALLRALRDGQIETAVEGTTLNQLINVAVAEKLAALRTEHYVEERAKRADLGAFEHFLERAGDAPPRPGDETLPD
jgi:predicted nucleic acid-binding protein